MPDLAARKHITIRPRVNSALERIHDERRKEFPDLVHKWADNEEVAFAHATKEDKGREDDA